MQAQLALFCNGTLMRFTLFLLLMSGLVCSCFAQSSPTPAQWKEVDDQLGRTGSVQPGDVYKVGLPRTDLHVTAGGVEIKPALGLAGGLPSAGRTFGDGHGRSRFDRRRSRTSHQEVAVGRDTTDRHTQSRPS